MAVCRPCLNLARPGNPRGFCTAPFSAISGCQIAHSAVNGSRRSLNRALAFCDPFDPEQKVVNDFESDIIFESAGARAILAESVLLEQQLLVVARSRRRAPGDIRAAHSGCRDCAGEGAAPLLSKFCVRRAPDAAAQKRAFPGESTGIQHGLPSSVKGTRIAAILGACPASAPVRPPGRHAKRRRWAPAQSDNESEIENTISAVQPWRFR